MKRGIKERGEQMEIPVYLEIERGLRAALENIRGVQRRLQEPESDMVDPEKRPTYHAASRAAEYISLAAKHLSELAESEELDLELLVREQEQQENVGMEGSGYAF